MQKVAIVHDWLTAPGGAEHVLAQLLIAYPNAVLFTICDFLEDKHRYLLMGRTPKTSFIQNLPLASKKHWLYLALMPLAIEQFDLSEYDIVISSSYSVAKGVLTDPSQTHLSYIYTPIRYAWHLQHQYLAEMNLSRGPLSWAVRALLHYLRIWDLRSAVGVDSFVAISNYVARQVTRQYKTECAVLYPPVDVDRFPLVTEKQDYYVTASRLVPYKRVDLIVKAFALMPDRKLVVIGDGPESARVREAAHGHANIEILGYQPHQILQQHLSNAKAFVFAAIEDFGIAPLEAQSCGTPVIALGKGAALETIRGLRAEEPTGVHFTEQTESSIMEAVEQFEKQKHRIQPINCRKNAERFSVDRFLPQFVGLVEEAQRQNPLLDVEAAPKTASPRRVPNEV